MKKIFFAALCGMLCLNVFMLNAQTATSVADGPWMLTSTWDCNCVPIDGYTVTINHNVTLASDYLISSGGITVNASGTLAQSGSHSMLVTTNGTLNIAGTFSFSALAIQGGTIHNTGTMSGLDSLYIDANFDNQGTILTQKLYTQNSFANEGPVTVTDFLNNAVTVNYSTISATNFTNALSFENYGEISFSDGVNQNTVNNKNIFASTHDFLNMGWFFNIVDTAIVSIANNCTNSDSINHDAHIYNVGSVLVLNNFVNRDTLDGISLGSFCIGQHTANYGAMLGLFEFCDNTPPAIAPYIDFNSGYINAGITWCTSPCISAVVENKNGALPVFPNPATDFLNAGIQYEKGQWMLVDISGRTVLNGSFSAASECIVDVSAINVGLYQLVLTGYSETHSSMVVIE